MVPFLAGQMRVGFSVGVLVMCAVDIDRYKWYISPIKGEMRGYKRLRKSKIREREQRVIGV